MARASACADAPLLSFYCFKTMTRPYAPKNQELFDQGLATRRAVLGSEYVDASINNATDFNIDMQELVTQYCWATCGTARGRAAAADRG